MTNGLDRLERLFAYKRRASPGPASQLINQTQLQLSEPQFPSPSFIRPKTTRMAARDEVRLRQAARRSPSVPENLTSQLLAEHSQPYGPPEMPMRSPSFSSRPVDGFLASPPVDQFLASLGDFHFPKPSTRDGPFPAPACLPLDIPRLPSPRCRTPLEIAIPTGRVDTPPSSDPNDSGLFLTTPPPSKRLPDMACRAPPTPDGTPDLGPLPDSHISASASLDAIDKSPSKALLTDLGESFDQLSLHRSYSQSSIAASAQLSFCSSTLREPDFNEFLNLSDDDIAESTPESPHVEHDAGMALPSMGLSISSTHPLTSSLLTLTPPRTSRPAAVAAFEAARIARRYDFDLVYVVNLWPDHTGDDVVGSSADAGANRDAKATPQPMMGRLLAAHGLHHVPSPLQISSLVHTTILRSDGWIEYRNLEAQGHDLARGYASSFYTGQYTRSGCPENTGPVSGVRLSERIDRGIVFAAYRKPRSGEDRLGRTFSDEELGDLHGEAEALVEMLIDIHVANRLRQPPTQHAVADETGPMPMQELTIS